MADPALHSMKESAGWFVPRSGNYECMQSAIVLKGVTKTFGKTKAVDQLDLVMPGDALYGFIEPNGAGKTSSIRMIMTILFPDSGEISIIGFPSALEAKDRIGYLPEERGLYRKMGVGAAAGRDRPDRSEI